jgi:hypothetical protein
MLNLSQELEANGDADDAADAETADDGGGGATPGARGGAAEPSAVGGSAAFDRTIDELRVHLEAVLGVERFNAAYDRCAHGARERRATRHE